MLTNLIYLHVACAYLSLILLLTRGVMSVRQIDWRAYKLLKITPHAVDTLLLLSGIGLTAYLLVGGFVNSGDLLWLVPKLIFIGLYVLFTARAFHKSQPFSLKNFVLAVVSFMAAMVYAATH